MKKEHFFFLLGGFAFGLLVGYGLFDAMQRHPDLDGSGRTAAVADAPAGPRAPGQGVPTSAGTGAPMVAKINELKRQLEADPSDLSAAKQIAEIYFQVQMWDQSAQFYDIALGLAPQDPNLLTDAGIVKKERGDYAGALVNFRMAQEADAAHWQSLFNTVVVAAFDLQQFELADAAMARLETYDPQPPQLPALKKAYEEFRAAPQEASVP